MGDEQREGPLALSSSGAWYTVRKKAEFIVIIKSYSFHHCLFSLAYCLGRGKNHVDGEPISKYLQKQSEESDMRATQPQTGIETGSLNKLFKIEGKLQGLEKITEQRGWNQEIETK